MALSEDPADVTCWEISRLIYNHCCSSKKDSCNNCPFNNYGTDRSEFKSGCGLNILKRVLLNYKGPVSSDAIAHFYSIKGVVPVSVEEIYIPVLEKAIDKVCNENSCGTCPIEKECRKEVLCK